MHALGSKYHHHHRAGGGGAQSRAPQATTTMLIRRRGGAGAGAAAPHTRLSASSPSSSSSSSPSAVTKRALLLAGSMAGLGSVAAASASAASSSSGATAATTTAATTTTTAVAAAATAATTTTATAVETFELDPRTGLPRLRYSATGYRTWMWTPPADALEEGMAAAAPIKINWAAAGDPGAPPVLLVHGYGASAYHYRHNLRPLADAGFRVYACDLAGFGWSERSTALRYGQARAWSRQLCDFVDEVVMPEHSAAAAGAPRAGDGAAKTVKVAIAGNSLGGYAAMAAAASRPEMFRAVALLNSAGPFEAVEKRSDKGAAAANAAADANAAAAREEEEQSERARRSSAEEIASADGDVFAALDARQRRLEASAEEEARRAPLSSALRTAGGSLARVAKRAVLYVGFQRAKQPQQIRDVLGMVYASKDPLDDDLVASIVAPTSDPRSAEVFAMINGIGAVGAATPPPPLTVDAAVMRLRRFGVPLALVWGEKDPWITPARAQQILKLAPEAAYYGIPGAGHCPHDDAPVETNAALADFFASI